MMKYLYIVLIAILLVTPASSRALNATPTANNASSPEVASDKNKASPNFGKASSIVSFLIGPNMGSICGYLKLPDKLKGICSKILNCVVDIAREELLPNSGKRAETADSRSDCGFMQCYAAAVGARKIQQKNLPQGQNKVAQARISTTLSGCSALCNNLPANSKAQKICGLSDCYDDAVKLVADPNHEFPEYCCSIVSGKWGGNIGRAIDTFCKGTSGITDLVCAAQWSTDETLTGECCAGIEDLKSTLSNPDVAVTYCQNAPAIEDCKIHWSIQAASCADARSKGLACKEVPNRACCSLIQQKESDTNVAKILDKMGITGTAASYEDTCGKVPQTTPALNSLCTTDPAFCATKVTNPTPATP